MNFNVLHQRLLQDVLEVGKDLPLVLTGGYAVQAHGLVDRLSRDIDVATNSDVPMEVIVAALVDGLGQRGWQWADDIRRRLYTETFDFNGDDE